MDQTVCRLWGDSIRDGAGAAASPSSSPIPLSKFSPTYHASHFHHAHHVLTETLWHRYLTAPGITLSFRDVTIVERSFWKQGTRLAVQNCSGFCEGGKLHVIVDIERRAIAGRSLMGALSGSIQPDSGTVTGNNVPVSSTRFRRAVGMVATEPDSVLFGNLSVAENIEFSLRMRCKCPPPPQSAIPNDVSVAPAVNVNRISWQLHEQSPHKFPAPPSSAPCSSWMTFSSVAHFDRVVAAASFFDLAIDAKAKSLTPLQRVLLVLAMELVLDPPIIFVVSNGAIASLDPHGMTELASYMKLMCTRLGKTLVCQLGSLPFPVFDRCDSVLLLGLEGQVLYGGGSQEMLSYFSTLGLPADTLSSPMLEAMVHSPSVIDRPGTLISSNSFQTNTSFSSVSFVAAAAAASNPVALQQHSKLAPALTPTRAASKACTDMMMTDEDDSESVLVINTGDAAVDLAKLWAESVDLTVKYAAVYYDSGVRRALALQQDEHAFANTWSGTMTGASPNNISFLKFQPQASGYQLANLCHVFVLQSLRQPDFYILWGILTLLLGLAAYLVGSQDENQMGMMNSRGLIFLLFFVTLQINVGFVQTYCAEIELFRYQRDSGFYSTLVFLATLLVRMITARIVYLATIVPFIVYLMQTSRNLITLVGLLSVSHAAIVYLKASLFQDARISQIFVLLYVGYSVVFSGFLVNLASVPQTIGYLSLMRSAYAAALVDELQGKPYSCDAGNSTNFVNASSYCYTGNHYLELQGFQDDSFERSKNILLVVFVAVIVLLALRLTWM